MIWPAATSAKSIKRTNFLWTRGDMRRIASDAPIAKSIWIGTDQGVLAAAGCWEHDHGIGLEFTLLTRRLQVIFECAKSGTCAINTLHSSKKWCRWYMLGMVCRNLCERYKARKPSAKLSRYNLGQKRCQVCEVFVIWYGRNCPCCNYQLRTRRRSS